MLGGFDLVLPLFGANTSPVLNLASGPVVPFVPLDET